MKIERIREEYYAATGTVSDLVRQLSLAGIAIIWVFKIGKEESGGIAYSADMASTLILFVAALACDLFQYVYKSIVWGSLNHFYWKKYHNDEKDVEISERWNWPTIFLFWVKAVLCLAGYVWVFRKIYAYL